MCAPLKPVTRLSSSPTDLTFDQTASPGGFFVYRAGDYDDRKRISRRSFTDSRHHHSPYSLR
ncbi:hypothetical protein D9F89_24035 [Escherichia coli]|nr:hypothetical protein [Escherichia coli]NCB87807.1 hypothetical protein [Gammaproteobacteria bacterium]RVS64568.1 hypothetical protein EOL10_02720 [Citrobacter freundii]